MPPKKGYVWMAVDDDGTVNFFDTRPKRGEFGTYAQGSWVSKNDNGRLLLCLNNEDSQDLFTRLPDMTWSDKPIKVRVQVLPC